MEQYVYKLLIVEDDSKLRSALKDYFEQYDFKVIVARDGEEGLERFFEEIDSLQLVILDGMLPKKDGFDVLSEIRKNSDIPAIFVTAREGEEDQLEGFRRGADGNIPKPFLMSVLKSQAMALIKRYTSISEEGLKKGALFFDIMAHEAYLNGELLDITHKDYELLLYLAQNEGALLSRETILNSLWGVSYEGGERTVDTHIRRLRNVMTEKYPYIHSIYGGGYKFEVADEE